MFKALLVGGPANGTSLHIKAGINVMVEHEGERFEYRRTEFVWGKSSWMIWTHGDEMPPDEALYQMIRKAEIPPLTS